jgi:hypothetical protein
MMKFLGMVANFAVVLVMAFLLAAACVEAIQLIAQTNSPDKRCEQGEIVSSVWGKGWVCIKGRVLSPSGSLPSASISSPLSRQVPAMSSRTATFLARVTSRATVLRPLPVFTAMSATNAFKFSF